MNTKLHILSGAKIHLLRGAALLLLIGIVAFQTNAQNLKEQVVNAKVSQGLLDLAAGVNATASSSPLDYNRSLGLVNGDAVVISAIPTKSCSSLISELNSLGAKNVSTFGGLVNATIPLSKVNQLSNCTNLQFATQAHKPVVNVGAVTSQGDVAQGSDRGKTEFGVDGTGVKVGLLSDTYNALGGEADGVTNGDLPGTGNPNGFTTPVQILEDLAAGSDEGRGMAEIVHDVAPGADLAFHTAFLGQADFANGIIELADAGSDVIVDDVGYFAAPFFQDGVIAQAVDIVTNAGVSYFSSAGNSARNSYQSDFRDGGTFNITSFGSLIGEYVMHDFDPSENVDIFQQVTLGPGGNLTFSLQWDDPFAAVCEGCPGADTDLDIFLFIAEDPNTALLFSLGNNIDGDAVEILGAVNNGTSAATAYIGFGKWTGAAGDNPNPTLVKYIDFGNTSVDEYATNSSTVFGHSNATGTNSVAAAAYFNTPAFRPDLTYAVAESFSSGGGTPILFDIQGNRISPEIRRNPDFTSIDGANTSFFGFDISIPFMGQVFDDDDFPNFFGTSAAAPHAAGGAALLKELAGDRLSPREITRALSRSAMDMDDRDTPGFDHGFDFKTGAGLIQIDRALGLLGRQVPRGAGRRVANVSAFPNPSSSGLFNVNIKSEDQETASIVVMNPNQRVVYRTSVNLTKGSNDVRVDLSRFNRGMYYVKVSSPSIQETLTLAK
ncbi:S8 family serine peptidase [Fulvivirgaceae bacterium BMA10]|uniref:S8 family serine peptidase n=1 Tax=Splendidivirga corallicola TaxID=3051826 RepID=A0ABT8KUS8_9BACT|nr:S8 family serine peptidase [Fulvivirgaceae bacterium BMA10]